MKYYGDNKNMQCCPYQKHNYCCPMMCPMMMQNPMMMGNPMMNNPMMNNSMMDMTQEENFDMDEMPDMGRKENPKMKSVDVKDLTD